MKKSIVGIVGGHSQNTSSEALAMAESVGFALGNAGMHMVCGGYDGIMEAACRGCQRGGGTTIGILKKNDTSGANPYVNFPIVTSMDVACNNIIVWTAQVLIAFEGRYGTLNEIALALDFKKPIIAVGHQPLLNFDAIKEERVVHFPHAHLAQVPEIIQAVKRWL